MKKQYNAFYAFEKDILTHSEVEGFLVIVYSCVNSFLCLQTINGNLYYQHHHDRVKELFKKLADDFYPFILARCEGCIFMVNIKYLNEQDYDTFNNIELVLPEPLRCGESFSALLWELTENVNKFFNKKNSPKKIQKKATSKELDSELPAKRECISAKIKNEKKTQELDKQLEDYFKYKDIEEGEVVEEEEIKAESSQR